MNTLSAEDPIAVAVVDAIRGGDLAKLERLLSENAALAASGVREEDATRSLLHVATDWPGHFPNVGESIRLLLKSGAEVNRGIKGQDTETALHWAASSNDVDAIDALIDGGADLNARGAVIAGGDPLEDAIGFQNWNAARRLAERGAKTNLGDEAALGLMDRIVQRFESATSPSKESVTYSFWNACCAGQLEAAKYLLSRGADINWVPDWCEETAMDGAIGSKNEDLIRWLTDTGAVTSKQKD